MKKRVAAPGGLAGRFLRILPALLLGSAVTGSSLLAQARPVDVAPTPNSFDLTVVAGERSTSNAFFSAEGDSPYGDYYSDMRLDLSAARRTDRTDWSLRYSPFYTRYMQYGQLDTSNHILDYRGTYTASRRWRVILAEHFTYSRDPLHVATEEGGYDPVLTSESKRWRNFAEVGMENDLSRSITLQSGLSGRVDRFQDPTLTDGRTWSARVGVLKHVGRVQSLTATCTYSMFELGSYEFLDEATVPPQTKTTDAPDFTSSGIYLGWERVVPGAFEFRVNGGAAEVLREGEGQRQFIGGAGYRQFFRHADLRVGFRQSLTADSGVASVTVSQNFYAGFSTRIGRITTLELVGDYGTRKSALDEGAILDLSYAGALLRGAVAVREKVRLLAEASYRLQRDTAAEGDVKVNGFFVGVSFEVF